MFKAFFGEKDVCEEETIEDHRKIVRKAQLKILSTNIVYNSEEDVFDTVATCINENGNIETLSIEGFHIEAEVTALVGALISLEEYEEDDEEYSIGTIYKEKPTKEQCMLW